MNTEILKNLIEAFEIATWGEAATTTCQAMSDGFTEVWWDFADENGNGPQFKVEYDAEMEPFSLQVCGTRTVLHVDD